MNLDEIRKRHQEDDRWFANPELPVPKEVRQAHQDRARLLEYAKKVEAILDHYMIDGVDNIAKRIDDISEDAIDCRQRIEELERQVDELEAQVNRTCRCELGPCEQVAFGGGYCPDCGGKVGEG